MNYVASLVYHLVLTGLLAVHSRIEQKLSHKNATEEKNADKEQDQVFGWKNIFQDFFHRSEVSFDEHQL